MVKKTKLQLSLADERGVDFAKIKEKKRVKALRKEKAKKKAEKQPAEEEEASEEGLEDEEDEGDEGSDEDEEEGAEGMFDLEALSDSSDSEVEMEERILRPKKAKPTKAAKPADDDVDDDEEEDEDEEDIPVEELEDLEDEDKEDLIPHSRLTINNTAALLASLNRIRIPTDSSAPFVTHQSVVSVTTTANDIPNVSDDLNRELQFYKQSRDAVLKARTLLRKEGVPFARPGDYFAEMVKSDEHVEKIRAKLVEEATNKKAAAEARKLRDLKKFGKQVQIAKLQERAKAKKDSLEKIKLLKRKRQDSGTKDTHETSDLFDVAVDNELRSGPRSAGKGGAGGGRPDGAQNHKRHKKNEKYGFGGKKRHAKSGDATSSGDLSGFSVKRNRSGFKGAGGAGKNRPGKARRKAMNG